MALSSFFGRRPALAWSVTLVVSLPLSAMAESQSTPNSNGPVVALDQDVNGPVLEEFISMIRAGDWEPARIMAPELLDRFEGTPRFDFFYAQLLLHDGETREAIFALERVLIMQPEQHRARLDLARAYYANNNLVRARTEFERVLETNPPPQVRTNIEAFLDRITAIERARDRQFNLFAGVEGGYDTNINGGGNLDGQLDPNLLGLTDLSDESLAIESAYTQYRFGARLVQPTSLKTGHVFGFLGQATQYLEDDSFNQTRITGQYRLQRALPRKSRAQISTNLSQSLLGGEAYQFSAALSGQATTPLFASLEGGLAAQLNMGFAQSDDASDSSTDAIGVLFTAAENNRRHRFDSQFVRFRRGGNNDGHLEWNGISNRYSLGWQLSGKWTTDVAFRHDLRTYQDDDLLFLQNNSNNQTKVRKDQLITADIGLSWQPASWLQTRTGSRFEWLDSNINAYERDRLVINQSVTLTF
ncbi:tetratricopeptide repeat protein [Saccharospirillum mangrovi]|uniref:tetratricopeptide repeat protein n=1 Tax=Saccharospirillum mangrovi TaxID=2161747 RepID=UPI000D3439F0|nr:tetratricopeptide repeat protein [Saccharospirillum mangrovi]